MSNLALHSNDPEEIKKRNLVQWEQQKNNSKHKCSMCKFPLDETTSLDWCEVCNFFELALSKRAYWVAVSLDDNRLNRSNRSY